MHAESKGSSLLPARMAMQLIRRSVRGGLLRRAGSALLPASRQTEVIPSLAASFLSSSAAGAAARIRGSPIRSKGQCIYCMLCDGSGSTRVIRNKRFRAMINGLKRYWTSKLVSEKASIVIATLYLSWSLKVSYDMYAARRTIMAYLDDKERNAGIRDVHKKAA